MLQYPKGYIHGLNTTKRINNFPNLKESNFQVNSLRTDDYNCVGCALFKEDALNMANAFIYFKHPDGSYDERLSTYIHFFKNQGFYISQNTEFDKNIDRICITYTEDDIFKHVCFQYANNIWKSKIGDWEDIEHSSIDVLLGRSYGSKFVIMEKRK